MHYVVGGDYNRFNNKLLDEFEGFDKEKDFEKMIDSIKDQFAYMDQDNNSGTDKMLTDPFTMISTFNQMEGSILKIINKKLDTEKEITRIKAENDVVLNDLEERENRNLKEETFFLNEKHKDEMQIEELRKECDNSNHEVSKMIRDVATTLFSDDENHIFNNVKLPDADLVREIIETLRIKELDTNTYVDEIEEFQKNDIFWPIVENRKKENKLLKLSEYKRVCEEIANGKEN